MRAKTPKGSAPVIATQFLHNAGEYDVIIGLQLVLLRERLSRKTAN